MKKYSFLALPIKIYRFQSFQCHSSTSFAAITLYNDLRRTYQTYSLSIDLRRISFKTTLRLNVAVFGDGTKSNMWVLVTVLYHDSLYQFRTPSTYDLFAKSLPFVGVAKLINFLLDILKSAGNGLVPSVFLYVCPHTIYLQHH